MYTHEPRACIVSIVRVFYVQKFKGSDPSCRLSCPMSVSYSPRTETELSGGDVNTVELSSVELGVGFFTACFPAYMPLYKVLFSGRSLRTRTKSGSTTNFKTSGTQRTIKMTNMTRGWYRNRQALGSDVEGLNSTTFAITPRTKDDQGHRLSTEPSHGILVTRKITTESVPSK